jgi:DMSO/TMAO reductase YedYZ molybdopterin-dependent catalytic subunit
MTRPGYFLRVPERGVHALTSYQTADEDLFLLAHMGLAEVNDLDWSLTVRGLLRNPASLRIADLHAMRQYLVTSVHECAGSPLSPAVPRRRVGNVVCSGVRLADVLEQCRVDPKAAFVWTHGLDCGDFSDLKCEPYVKDIPLDKALSPEVLLATCMNGIPLTSDRGGPVRLVVPGWYGTNSVKWLGALTVSDRRAPGPFTTRFYNDPVPNGTRPVWAMAPESIIVSPGPDDSPSRGQPYLISGWAWSESGVAKVDVRTGVNEVWVPAAVDSRRDFGWQRFSLSWVFQSGHHEISCTCFDASGQGQPESGARNAVHTVAIDIR